MRSSCVYLVETEIIERNFSGKVFGFKFGKENSRDFIEGF